MGQSYWGGTVPQVTWAHAMQGFNSETNQKSVQLTKQWCNIGHKNLVVLLGLGIRRMESLDGTAFGTKRPDPIMFWNAFLLFVIL